MDSLVAPGGKSFLLAHKAAVCVAVFYYQHSRAGWKKLAQADVLGVGVAGRNLCTRLLRTPLQLPPPPKPGAAPDSSLPKGDIRPVVRGQARISEEMFRPKAYTAGPGILVFHSTSFCYNVDEMQ